MKVTETDVIRSSEQELLDNVIAELDWSAIETLLKKKHGIRLQDDVALKTGDLVVHGGQVAYKMSFDVKLTLDVLFDRKGECIHLSAGETDPDEASDANPAPVTVDAPAANETVSDLADMMRDINAPEPEKSETADASDEEDPELATEPAVEDEPSPIS